jgi:hypothetical protein
MPVFYYCQFISGVDGRNAEDSAPDDLIIEARKLEEIAAK